MVFVLTSEQSHVSFRNLMIHFAQSGLLLREAAYTASHYTLPADEFLTPHRIAIYSWNRELRSKELVRSERDDDKRWYVLYLSCCCKSIRRWL
jgi:hypothetical protein